mmetsp:Transcript_7488/g.19330  ORF Transcript_7488/g.19330 Transcript_7488/m.19330 type:complete len:449 (-) Transcript_7488:1878-3224(-)
MLNLSKGTMETIIVSSLLIGYVGRYFSESHFYTTMALFKSEEGLDDTKVGLMLSTSYLVRFFAKLSYGLITERLGGKVTWVMCMTGAAVSSSLFTLGRSNIYYFTAAWCILQFFLAGAWVALVRVASAWVKESRRGIVMSILSLGLVLGDAVSRQIFGLFISSKPGVTWRESFVYGALGTILLNVPAFIFLSNSPLSAGYNDLKLKPSQPSPKGASSSSTNIGPHTRIRNLLSSPTFVLVLGLSFCLYSMREFLKSFTAQYLIDVYCNGSGQCSFSSAAASFGASGSTWFPLLGGASTLVAGYVKDMFAKHNRAFVLVGLLSVLVSSLSFLSSSGITLAKDSAIYFSALNGFGLFGPFTLLAGSFAMDEGGDSETAALASALIDGVGNLGAAISMLGKASLFSSADGSTDWARAFGLLAFLTLAAMATSILLLVQDWRKATKERPKDG